MKIKGYGYNRSTGIGFIEYIPGIFGWLFGRETKRKEYRRKQNEKWLFGGWIWIDAITGEECHVTVLDNAYDLGDI